jgi:BMFP domain-containing protein YqiC
MKEESGGMEDLRSLLKSVSDIPQFKAFAPFKSIEIYERSLLNYIRISTNLNNSIMEYYMLIGVTYAEAYKKTLERIKAGEVEGEKGKEALNRLWIDTFEKEFNILMSSERFARVVSSITSAYADILKCISDIVESAFKELGLPTRSEMDSVYREMVKMKRDIASLAEEVNKLKASITGSPMV